MLISFPPASISWIALQKSKDFILKTLDEHKEEESEDVVKLRFHIAIGFLSSPNLLQCMDSTRSIDKMIIHSAMSKYKRQNYQQ